MSGVDFSSLGRLMPGEFIPSLSQSRKYTFKTTLYHNKLGYCLLYILLKPHWKRRKITIYQHSLFSSLTIQLSNWPSFCKYSLHCNHNNKLQVCSYSTFHTIDLSVYAFSQFFCFCQFQPFGEADAKGQYDPNFGWCHPFNLHCQQTSLGVDKTLSEVHKLALKIKKGESNFNSPCHERVYDVTCGRCMHYIILCTRITKLLLEL